MKKHCLILTAAWILFGFAVTAGATPSISFTPTGTYPMSAGDTVSFDVLFTADDDGDIFDGVNLQLAYDATELSFVSYETLSAQNWTELFGPVQDVTQEDGSFLANYNCAYLFGDYSITVGANESVSMGTFIFEATADLIEDGLSDLWVVDSLQVGELTYTSKLFFNGDYSGANASTLLTVAGADVSPVPVPGAVWLMATGLLGAVGIRRRNA